MEPMVSPFLSVPKQERAVHAGIRPLHVLCLLLQALAALVIYEGFARGDLAGVWTWLMGNPLMFLINYGLLLGLFLFLSVMPSPGRGICAAVLMGMLGAVGLINDYKVRLRFEPVLLTDIFQLGNMKAALEGIPMNIRWEPVILLGLGLALAIAGCILFFRRSIALRQRLCLSAAGIVLFSAMLPLCSFHNPLIKTRTDLVDYSRAGGGLYTMIAIEERRRSLAYSGYTPEDAQQAYQKVLALAGEDAPETPNIIFVLSESFTDQAHLSPYLDLTEKLTPFYDELMSSAISGDIYVPKQGGGTSETEFEVLTGLSSEYSINPYSAGLPELHSVAAVLRERGYRAATLHWYTGVFYNRYQNLRQLGFDEFHTTDTSLSPFETTGMFVSDEEHYRGILAKLRQTQEKDFVLCLTMQNHFPYDQDVLDALRGDAAAFTNDLSAENFRNAANYCYLLRQSDEALKAFIQELSAFEEPTLLVFFGDHIPPLGDAFYEEVGMPVNTKTGHLAPYFIWSNQGDMEPKQADMQAWQLGAFALAQAGIDSDPFLHYVESLRRAGIDRDDTYELLTYDALYGDQAAYQAAGFEILSPRWEIGGKMEMTSVSAAQIGDRIYILPKLADSSHAFRLSVNGQGLENWCILPSKEPVTLQCVLSNYRGTMYNYSNAMTFSSTEELLAQTQAPPMRILPLGEEAYTQPEAANGYVKVRTVRRFAAQAACALVDGQRLEWQHAYALTRAGRFHLPLKSVFQTAQPLTLTIRQKDFEGYEMTSEGVRQYMEDHGGELYLLGGYTLLP